MVNYALNHHWCETSLLLQAALNYICDVQRFHCQKWGISSVSLQEWRNLYGIRIFSVFSLLQCVGQKCMGHMYVTMASGLISGSTSVTHFQLWIWHSFWHENLWDYQDNFIYKTACCYSKDSQNLEVFWIIVVHYRLYILYC